MADYRVTWEIDIEADSPEAAAREALKIQRDKTSQATVFDVFSDEECSPYRIDIEELDQRKGSIQ